MVSLPRKKLRETGLAWPGSIWQRDVSLAGLDVSRIALIEDLEALH